jgi:cytoplasmic tRNA 2-thiolation protein 1
MDYFSTECIYSPEAFRGTARGLIKNLEKVRPSAILDIVRSGEDMARLTPDKGQAACGCDEGEGLGGCGSANGRTSGNEMAQVEASLKKKHESTALETEITSNGTPKDDAVPLPIRTKKQKETPAPKQNLGKCVKCGYMSSQTMCQACTLLEGLNKNRAEIAI